MTDAITGRILAAADHLDYLHEGSRHIPTDLIHDRDFRVGLVCTRNQQVGQTVAQFFYGTAAEVFMTLGPACLPLAATLLRAVAAGSLDVPSDVTMSAYRLADHILKIKETTDG